MSGLKYIIWESSTDEELRGVLIKRAHFKAIHTEGGSTVRRGVIIERGALTEGVLYIQNHLFLLQNDIELDYGTFLLL